MTHFGSYYAPLIANFEDWQTEERRLQNLCRLFLFSHLTLRYNENKYLPDNLGLKIGKWLCVRQIHYEVAGLD